MCVKKFKGSWYDLVASFRSAVSICLVIELLKQPVDLVTPPVKCFYHKNFLITLLSPLDIMSILIADSQHSHWL